MDIFMQFLGLYVEVFKKYPLAASITTLLFVIAYLLWTKINEEQRRMPDAVWKRPAFILFIGWCILTPLLGLIVSTLNILTNVVTVVGGLYVQVFKTYPEAGAGVTVIFLGAYFVWRLIIT